MTVATAAAPSAVRRRRRGVAGWAVIALVLVAIGLVAVAMLDASRWAPRDPLDPESAGPDGTRALARILEARGIDVVVARDREAALDALAEGPATLVLPDSPYLSDEALTALAEASPDVVIAQPRARGLRLLLDGAAPAGYGPADAVAPGCDLAEARTTGPVAVGALVDAPTATTRCYPVGESAGLVVLQNGDGRVSAVDGTVLFTNEHLAENGNAALGVSLLGRLGRVVWLVPTLADSDLAGGAPTLGDLTPPWVTPAILLLVLATVAAGLWRGRRFGPLVAERMPVSVRASETTEGRGRLYAQSRDAPHAAEQLRHAARERIARLLRLGRGAGAERIADAAAARTGLDRALVRELLVTRTPSSDQELVDLATGLHELEAAVAAAIRPSRGAP